MDNKVKIIRIRRGINGYKYCACSDNGKYIGNLEHLRDARLHWKKEIEWGLIKLIRELDKYPDDMQDEEVQ